MLRKALCIMLLADLTDWLSPESRSYWRHWTLSTMSWCPPSMSDMAARAPFIKSVIFIPQPSAHLEGLEVGVVPLLGDDDDVAPDPGGVVAEGPDDLGLVLQVLELLVLRGDAPDHGVHPAHLGGLELEEVGPHQVAVLRLGVCLVQPHRVQPDRVVGVVEVPVDGVGRGRPVTGRLGGRRVAGVEVHGGGLTPPCRPHHHDTRVSSEGRVGQSLLRSPGVPRAVGGVGARQYEVRGV